MAIILLAACASTPKKSGSTKVEIEDGTPWVDPEAYRVVGVRRAIASRGPRPGVVVLRHATVLTAAGQRIEDGTVVLDGGRLTAVGGADVVSPAGAEEVDATGKFVTPGIIDTHSHLGVYPSPAVDAHQDGNEMTGPVTAGSAAEYAYWPQDPGIAHALAAGVTVAQILPGSANMIGGHGFVVEMRPGRTVDEIKLQGAPDTLKMACGENPKRVYGEKGGPMTRMAMYEQFRQQFAEAADYAVSQGVYKAKRKAWLERRAKAKELVAKKKADGADAYVPAEEPPERPKRDAKLETLAKVLDGGIIVNVHCYRASDLEQMVRIADEAGFQIRSFHHALEAYKVRDLLISRGIAINTWADWWGFKMESLDGIPENAALYTESGGRAVLHSDSGIEMQHLPAEAGKVWAAARAAGIPITEDQALGWVTANAAWVLGIEKLTGTLEVGKRADVVVWDKYPLSIYARPEQVYVGGARLIDRRVGRPLTDFELGQSGIGGAP